MILVSVWIQRFQAFRKCACDSTRIYSWKSQEAAQKDCWTSILSVQDSVILVCCVSLLSDLSSVYFLLWICLLLWTRHRSSLYFLIEVIQQRYSGEKTGNLEIMVSGGCIDLYEEYFLPMLMASVFHSTSTPPFPCKQCRYSRGCCVSRLCKFWLGGHAL